MSAQRYAAANSQATDAPSRAPADVLRVVLAYAVFAGFWILLSDIVVGWLFIDPAQIVQASTIKGWLFVVVTSLLLYGLIARLREHALAGIRQELAAQDEKTRALGLLSAISDNSSDAIFAKDLEGRHLLVNPEVARVAGKNADEMLGQDDTFLFPLQAAIIRANDRRVMDENRIFTYEETVATTDGERTFLATKGPLHDAQGQVSGMFGISRDITERHQSVLLLRQHAEALRESEARREAEMAAALEVQQQARIAALNLMEDAIAARARAEAALEALGDSQRRMARLFESDLIGIVFADMQKIIDANDAFLRIVGYTREDLAAGALKWPQMTPPEWFGVDATGVQELLAEGACRPFEKEYFRKDDSRVAILIGGALIERTPLTWVCFVQDITTRKQAEARLAEQHDELRRWQQLMLGRENRVLAMKKELNSLLAERGEPPRYPSAAHPDTEL